MCPTGVNRARINFDGILTIRQKVKAAFENPHQSRHFSVVQKGGGAPTPVQLGYRARTRKFGKLQVNFALEIVQIARGFRMVFGNDLVAAAVIADSTAERQMDI
jgi:hypothetical protein